MNGSRVSTDSRPFPTSLPLRAQSPPRHLFITEVNRNDVFFPLSRLASFSAAWEALAQHPKFSKVQPADVEKIRRKHPNDVELQAFDFLMTWYQKYERRFRTVSYLIEATKAMGLNEAAECLEDVLVENGVAGGDRASVEESAGTNGAVATNGGLTSHHRSNDRRGNESPGKPSIGCKRCSPGSPVGASPKKLHGGTSSSLSFSSAIPPELGLFQSFGNLSVEDDSRSELPCYPLDRNPLGFAVIINNQNYQQDLTIEGSKRFDNREGTKKDAERLR